MDARYGLKPQDILVLVKLVVDAGKKPLQVELSQDLGIGQSEVGNSLKRLKGSKLIDSDLKPIRPSVTEFLICAVKYVYPCAPGPITRGTLTAHSASPLNQKIKVSANDAYVWPDPEGNISGQAIEPFYRSVPFAAKKDRRLYDVLALIDALRVGRAREVEIATAELKLRIRGKV